ncbi:hypothetical protein N657DRAFT_106049 [Parathielavia appendiculata]|uniref:Uncharacterized protein n=1 Tax=Parathielavia appendiculata TaxID=2587402 RepID=A0AAN6Z238_9PEZI|nr:hypothetical protein N657DRAFT_106049 [Parathielavia appendiculata]
MPLIDAAHLKTLHERSMAQARGIDIVCRNSASMSSTGTWSFGQWRPTSSIVQISTPCSVSSKFIESSTAKSMATPKDSPSNSGTQTGQRREDESGNTS